MCNFTSFASVEIIGQETIGETTIPFHETVKFAFWISISILLLASLGKYFLANKSNWSVWFNWIVETPIDLCVILISLLATIHIKQSAGEAFLYMTIVIIIVAICCILRRHALKYYTNTSDKSSWVSILLTLIIMTITFVCCLKVYDVII